MIGFSMTITLKGKKEEEKFYALWERAMENIHNVQGLQETVTAKVLDKKFTYHMFSLWNSEEDIETWLHNPVYHEVIRKQGDALIESFVSYKWEPIRPRKTRGI